MRGKGRVPESRDCVRRKLHGPPTGSIQFSLGSFDALLNLGFISVFDRKAQPSFSDKKTYKAPQVRSLPGAWKTWHITGPWLSRGPLYKLRENVSL